MRIAINCRSYLKRQYTGIGRYAYNLVESLSKVDQQNEYYLYAQKKVFDFKRQLPYAPGNNFFVKADWFNRGFEKTLGKMDICHLPSPDFIDWEKVKIVVTVHDLVYRAYPQGHTQETIDTTERQLRDVVKKADKIICCSQNTIDDLHKYFYLDKSKVHLVYQGVDKESFFPLKEEKREVAQNILKQKLKLTLPFILFVGTNEPRKNLKNLLHAVAELKSKNYFKGTLAVAGMEGWLSDDVQDLIRQLALEECVKFLGYVTNEELRYLYNLCEVFVFPSFYEGFGYPIVEAFSCGAAVVTSDVSSCREVAQDAAVTVDPSKAEQIATAIHRFLNDGPLRKQYQEKALKRAQDFSFLKTAQETLKIYEQMAR